MIVIWITGPAKQAFAGRTDFDAVAQLTIEGDDVVVGVALNKL